MELEITRIHSMRNTYFVASFGPGVFFERGVKGRRNLGGRRQARGDRSAEKPRDEIETFLRSGARNHHGKRVFFGRKANHIVLAGKLASRLYKTAGILENVKTAKRQAFIIKRLILTVFPKRARRLLF